MTYHEFLESKMVIAPESGVEIDPGEVNPALKPHQRDAVVRARDTNVPSSFDADNHVGRNGAPILSPEEVEIL